MTLAEYPLHNSQRGWFSRAIYFAMQANPNVAIVNGDLGYKMFSPHERDFPDRYFNVGAAEQLGVGASVGLALAGRIPFFFSITPFALFRPFEWLRNYVQHEGVPVRIVGSGLDKDYAHDGITHHAEDARAVLALFPAIQTYFPETPEAVPDMVRAMIESDKPSFLCLRR